MQNWGSQTNYQLNQLPWTCIQKSQCNIESHMFHTNKPVFSVSCSSRNIGLINWAQNNQRLGICMWYVLCCANRTFVPCLKTRILSETRDIFVTVVHRNKLFKSKIFFMLEAVRVFLLLKTVACKSMAQNWNYNGAKDQFWKRTCWSSPIKFDGIISGCQEYLVF